MQVAPRLKVGNQLDQAEREALMCGRYTLARGEQEIAERFGVSQLNFEFKPRFNVTPSQLVPVVLEVNGRRAIELMRWGLVPSWVKELKECKPSMNARVETVASKPSFKKCLIKQRCLIPADGFYEWRQEGKRKTPMWIHLPEREIFAFAGLFDEWTDKESGTVLRSCTIITRQANEYVSAVHDRMPFILQRQDEQTWLGTEQKDPAALLNLCFPSVPARLTMHQVSTRVNSGAVESADLIEAVGEAP